MAVHEKATVRKRSGGTEGGRREGGDEGGDEAARGARRLLVQGYSAREEAAYRLRALARLLLWTAVGLAVAVGLGAYLWWGYHASRSVTIYFLSRRAWNFDFWPFTDMRRPPGQD